MLECVMNVSEGRDRAVIDRLVATAGSDLLDLHQDPDHHRSVFTLVGEAAARAVAAEAVALLDLRSHRGAHPRFGVVDVVPFVPLGDAGLDDAVRARDAFAEWAGDRLELPCFRYGPERTLPEVRRQAFGKLAPDVGPARPHPTAGACAVGARPVLVAWNLWLARPDLDAARAIARQLRSPSVRALGLAVGPHVQVSCNLVAPTLVGPADVYDQVAALTAIDHAELVGLAPFEVLDRTPPDRWPQLDLDRSRTIEARLQARAARGGQGPAADG